MTNAIDPVVTDLGNNAKVWRHPSSFTMALDSSDLRHLAEIIRTVSELYPAVSREGKGAIAKNLVRMAIELEASANLADAEKESDREEAARHDAEVDAAQEAAERNSSDNG